jgi:RNA polymerase sigma-70 factor (ECF subfamily)
MSLKDEARLADRLIAGEPSAFRELVETYKRKVYGLAFEMTRNHADAEDISQISFMKIHRSAGLIQPGRGLSTWIYRIVYNTALDHIRKRQSSPREALPSNVSGQPVFDPPDPGAGPEKAAEDVCLRRRIDEALSKVSERERTVFILRHYHDLKVREIAESLGVSLGAVKSYLFRSMRRLQKELADIEPCLDKGDRE